MTEASMLDRRRFCRILFRAPVTVEYGGQCWQTDVADISLKGILLDKPSDWPANLPTAEVHLRLPLSEENVVSIEATLSHTGARQLGFVYRSLDIDSATLLRRLIELNLGDEALLERELSALVHTGS